MPPTMEFATLAEKRVLLPISQAKDSTQRKMVQKSVIDPNDAANAKKHKKLSQGYAKCASHQQSMVKITAKNISICSKATKRNRKYTIDNKHFNTIIINVRIVARTTRCF
jgi:hypothetical protein